MREILVFYLVMCAATRVGATQAPQEEGTRWAIEATGNAGIRLPGSNGLRSYSFSPGDPKGQVTQGVAAVLGARVTAWSGRRLGVDLSVDYAPSQGTDVFGESGNVTTASMRLLVGLVPRTAPKSLYVAAGIARVAHGGTAYSFTRLNGSAWGPVVGVGGRATLGRRIALFAEANEYTYTLSGARSPTSPFAPNPREYDVAVSLGLSIAPWWRRAA